MSNPSNDDRDELFVPPILGLDGQPVEITDEKLHELIDAMQETLTPQEREMVEHGQDGDEYIVANKILMGHGVMRHEEYDDEPVLIMQVAYYCPSCSKEHTMDVALRAIPSLANLMRQAADIVEEIAA